MSAIHRVDDVASMDARRYFMLAGRLPAYPGVMQVRVQAVLAENTPSAGPGVPSAPPGPTVGPTVPLELNTAHRGDGRAYPPVFQNLTPKGGGA